MISTLTFLPQPSDDNTKLKCEGSNPRLPNSALEDTLIMNVLCKSLFSLPLNIHFHIDLLSLSLSGATYHLVISVEIFLVSFMCATHSKWIKCLLYATWTEQFFFFLLLLHAKVYGRKMDDEQLLVIIVMLCYVYTRWKERKREKEAK